MGTFPQSSSRPHPHALTTAFSNRVAETQRLLLMKSRPKAAFNLEVFLDASGVSKRTVSFDPGHTIFSQGDLCDSVFYIRTGAVKLSVLSKTGRECVVGILGVGDFFGEGCLAGQPVRVC